ncbi:MAG: hypothetical protein JOZ10_16145 [Acidobacteria bacterium]|nr:hypothetical protein [Acidobacteriota bacterium]
MHVNGNSHVGPVPTKERVGAHVVQVFRVEQTDGVFVRMLSPEYKGLFTHFYQKRSHYCAGDACKIPNHASDRVWKGYVAAERLLRAAKPIWVPVCLEITENLELDFRHTYQRGQLWELFKDDLGKGKKNAIKGKLHLDPPPENLRKPFDILPCLRALYHRDVIDLRHGSPIPDRVWVEEVEGELPLALQHEGYGKVELPDDYNMAEELKKRQRMKVVNTTSPTEKKAQRGY